MTSSDAAFDPRVFIEPKIIIKLRGEGPFHRESFESLPVVRARNGKVDQVIDQKCAQVSFGFAHQVFDGAAFRDQPAWLRKVAPGMIQAIEELREDTGSVEDAYPDSILSLRLIPAPLPHCFGGWGDFENLPARWGFDPAHPSANDIDLPKQWGLFAIHAVDAWPQAPKQGQGIRVGVLDTGISTHTPDLQRLVVGNRVQGQNFTKGPDEDRHGHGTHVASIAGASGDDGTRVAGVAWQADLLSYKILDQDGLGQASDAVSAVRAAIAGGARILLTSWGVLEPVPCLEHALEEARRAGILIVAAAGNLAVSGPFYPAKYAEKLDNVLAVGATTWNCEAQSEGPAEISNRGDWIEIGAPGVAIVSDGKDGELKQLDGTSMAAAFVAGAAALVLGEFPNLGYLDLKNRLLAGADSIPALQEAWQGGRRLNVEKSLTLTDAQVDAWAAQRPAAAATGVGQPT